MTFSDLLARISSNTYDLLSTEETAQPCTVLVNIAGLEGLLIILKEKLGIVEESFEDEETNGDVFVRTHNYAYAEMPGGNKKWFKRLADKWEALDCDSEHICEFCEILDAKLENILWPTNGVRGN